MYDLEYIFNKIKDIGQLIQIIRIDRQNIIYGKKIWNLLFLLISDINYNKDLLLEASNYILNEDNINIIVNRINLAPLLNNSVYPDYFLNNIVKIFNNSNYNNINLSLLMHIAFDVGQLEYLSNKYQMYMVNDCISKLVFDITIYKNIFNIISTIGDKFKAYYKIDLLNQHHLFTEFVIQEINNLIKLYGNEFIIQLNKYKINKEKIKWFFETIMNDDIKNGDLFNINESNTFSERVYKVIYGNLRNDYINNSENPSCKYILNISYSILYGMYDFLTSKSDNINFEKIIELIFYMGCFKNSLINVGQTVLSYLFTTLINFDVNSKNELLTITTYLIDNDNIPNLYIAQKLEQIFNKLNSTIFSHTINNFNINEENIKYLPIEVTKLYCIIKPKEITNINILTEKLTNITTIFATNNDLIINNYYTELYNKITKINNIEITSILTPQNDLELLGISINNTENNNQLSQEPTTQEPTTQEPTTQEPTTQEPIAQSKLHPQQLDNNFNYKYLKYKIKYFKLANLLSINNQNGGSSKKIIIHISGCSGAGKTTLGNKLKKTYGNKIVVMDIDILRHKFIQKEYGKQPIKKFNKEKYQAYIDNYILQQHRPLVFVGLNIMPWWHKNLYYNMHPNYKFYIKLDNDTIFTQRCSRFINDVFIEHKKELINNLIKDDNKLTDIYKFGLKNECNYKTIIKMNDIWNKDYKEQGYKFLSQEEIFNEILKII